MTLEQTINTTLDVFDRSASGLSQAEYKEALEEIVSQLESRLDCVEAELKAEGEDE